MTQSLDRRTLVAIGVISAFGLALRLLGARGGLWLDEAWSAQQAQAVGSAAGVFLRINHDNNHHLNSLWLLAAGPGAPPMLQRALSIACGTAAIGVSALIAGRQGRLAAIVTAWLFAISPILVTMGSEARGYAPMALALLGVVALLQRPAPRAIPLGVVALLGTLAQATMVFGLAAIGAASAVTALRRDGFSGLRQTAITLFPAAVGSGLALASILIPAWLSPTGMQVGRYDAYSASAQIHALAQATAHTLGLPDRLWILIVIPIILVIAHRMRAPHRGFVWCAAVALPVALALLHVGNTGYARYYLVGAMAVLLVTGVVIARGLIDGDHRRWIAVVALAVISVGSLLHDTILLIDRRGDPSAVIAALRDRAPAGASVVIDQPTGSAIVAQAALSAGYRVRLHEAPCPARRFVFVDQPSRFVFPGAIMRCGMSYDLVAGRAAHGLSGTDWTLYEARR